MVILGTQYAGEIKQGSLYSKNSAIPVQPARSVPPAQRALVLHASANVGPDSDVSCVLGLSGTGNTTRSEDPKYNLIGEGEHYGIQKVC